MFIIPANSRNLKCCYLLLNENFAQTFSSVFGGGIFTFTHCFSFRLAKFQHQSSKNLGKFSKSENCYPYFEIVASCRNSTPSLMESFNITFKFRLAEFSTIKSSKLIKILEI